MAFCSYVYYYPAQAQDHDEILRLGPLAWPTSVTLLPDFKLSTWSRGASSLTNASRLINVRHMRASRLLVPLSFIASFYCTKSFFIHRISKTSCSQKQRDYFDGFIVEAFERVISLGQVLLCSEGESFTGSNTCHSTRIVLKTLINDGKV